MRTSIHFVILASKALCKLINELVEKVKLLSSNKDKSPMFSVNNLANDVKCEHYTGFPMLKPGMNSENVKLVSAPNAHTGLDVDDGSVAKSSFS